LLGGLREGHVEYKPRLIVTNPQVDIDNCYFFTILLLLILLYNYEWFMDDEFKRKWKEVIVSRFEQSVPTTGPVS
jgi:hypothetical protein